MKNEAAGAAADLTKTIIGMSKGVPVFKVIRHQCVACQKRAVMNNDGLRVCSNHAGMR